MELSFVMHAHGDGETVDRTRRPRFRFRIVLRATVKPLVEPSFGSPPENDAEQAAVLETISKRGQTPERKGVCPLLEIVPYPSTWNMPHCWWENQSNSSGLSGK